MIVYIHMTLLMNKWYPFKVFFSLWMLLKKKHFRKPGKSGNLGSLNYTQVICLMGSPENENNQLRKPTLNTAHFPTVNIDITFKHHPLTFINSANMWSTQDYYICWYSSPFTYNLQYHWPNIKKNRISACLHVLYFPNFTFLYIQHVQASSSVMCCVFVKACLCKQIAKCHSV